jgi:hypothetical protein
MFAGSNGWGRLAVLPLLILVEPQQRRRLFLIHVQRVDLDDQAVPIDCYLEVGHWVGGALDGSDRVGDPDELSERPNLSERPRRRGIVRRGGVTKAALQPLFESASPERSNCPIGGPSSRLVLRMIPRAQNAGQWLLFVRLWRPQNFFDAIRVLGGEFMQAKLCQQLRISAARLGMHEILNQRPVTIDNLSIAMISRPRSRGPSRRSGNSKAVLRNR